ncbi:hypothetical protein ACS0X5_20190 [Burkholderia gladioli]|uniref:hypothetical protein n=1 Tax=Burkholderia gladioli TaxID=28095 RepID=UPI001641D8C2|nr:hypothetical protein [Burkholderia gladioli]
MIKRLEQMLKQVEKQLAQAHNETERQALLQEIELISGQLQQALAALSKAMNGQTGGASSVDIHA